MANITLRQLRALVETCRAGKLALAAERLHVTPGALSMLLKQLEAELGAELFERTSRRLVPTDAAMHAVAIAERVLADLNRLEDEVGNFQALAQGRVSVAGTPAMVAQLLPGTVMRFKVAHPRVTVSIEDCAPDELWSLVSGGHCDLGVGSPDLRDKGLESDVLARDKICVICRRDDPLAAHASLKWGVLAKNPFITVKRASGIRRLIDQTLLNLRMDVKPAIEVTYLESALALTKAGLAIAVLPSFFVRGSVHGSDLVARPLTAPTVKRDILLLRKRGRALSPAAARFREDLMQEVASIAQQGMLESTQTGSAS
jgi:DNA-binding transcriptional LysR family regulator